MNHIYTYDGIGGYTPKRKSLIELFNGFVEKYGSSVEGLLDAANDLEGELYYLAAKGQITSWDCEAGQHIIIIYYLLKNNCQLMETCRKNEKFPLILVWGEKLQLKQDSDMMSVMDAVTKKKVIATLEIVSSVTAFDGICINNIGSKKLRCEIVKMSPAHKFDAMSKLLRYICACFVEGGDITIIANGQNGEKDKVYAVRILQGIGLEAVPAEQVREIVTKAHISEDEVICCDFPMDEFESYLVSAD